MGTMVQIAKAMSAMVATSQQNLRQPARGPPHGQHPNGRGSERSPSFNGLRGGKEAPPRYPRMQRGDSGELEDRNTPTPPRERRQSSRDAPRDPHRERDANRGRDQYRNPPPQRAPTPEQRKQRSTREPGSPGQELQGRDGGRAAKLIDPERPKPARPPATRTPSPGEPLTLGVGGRGGLSA